MMAMAGHAPQPRCWVGRSARTKRIRLRKKPQRNPKDGQRGETVSSVARLERRKISGEIVYFLVAQRGSHAIHDRRIAGFVSIGL